MLNMKGNYAENYRARSVILKFLSGVCMNVHADEGDNSNSGVNTPTPSAPSSSSPAVDLEKIIAQVRREEKDKLYGEINKLKENVKTLKDNNNNYLMQIATLTERLEAANNKNAEVNVDALNSKIKELETQLEDAKKNAPDADAIRKEIEAEYEVKMYLKEQLDSNKDKILSSFASKVGGKTKDEVDASIKSAIEDSTAIKKELGLIDDDGNPVNKDTDKGNKSDAPTESPSKRKKSVPAPAPGKPEEKTFDSDYIRNLDVNSDEYKEFRKKMGLR